MERWRSEGTATPPGERSPAGGGDLPPSGRMDCDRYVGELSNLLPPVYAPVLAGLPRWRASAPFDFDGLTAFYQENGCGLFARYRAFVWDSGELIPVADPDCPGRRS